MRVVNNAILLDGVELFSGNADNLLTELSRLRATSRPELVVTPNVDQAINLSENDEFRASFRGASLRIIDGMPLVVLGRMLGAREASRFTGAELLPLLAGLATHQNWKLAVLGGAEGVAQRAAANLNERIGAERVLAVPLPKINAVDDPGAAGAIDQLHSEAPDFVFICLGSPKQELWYEYWRESLPPAVYIGAGAAIDFAAGTAVRAPVPLQRLGLEWVWRLIQDPKRLAYRYLIKGPRFLAIVARSLVQR